MAVGAIILRAKYNIAYFYCQAFSANILIDPQREPFLIKPYYKTIDFYGQYIDS